MAAARGTTHPPTRVRGTVDQWSIGGILVLLRLRGWSGPSDRTRACRSSCEQGLPELRRGQGGAPGRPAGGRHAARVKLGPFSSRCNTFITPALFKGMCSLAFTCSSYLMLVSAITEYSDARCNAMASTRERERERDVGSYLKPLRNDVSDHSIIPRSTTLS
jgi:hypothetical protein